MRGALDLRDLTFERGFDGYEHSCRLTGVTPL